MLAKMKMRYACLEPAANRTRSVRLWDQLW
jgi:hypothetical protein